MSEIWREMGGEKPPLAWRLFASLMIIAPCIVGAVSVELIQAFCYLRGDYND